MAALDSQPRKRSDVKWKQTGRSGILLDLKTGDYFELDETALAIWRMLDGKSSLAKVVGKLAQAYAAPEKIIEKDVTHFVSELRKRKLIDDGKS
jgi:coenzyme PQQ biosynthesis protein PqqD